MYPAAVTSRLAVVVPWSETTKTFVLDACCSIEKVANGEDVPTPARPMAVSPIELRLVTTNEVRVEEPTAKAGPAILLSFTERRPHGVVVLYPV